MRHYDLYGNHLRRASTLEQQARDALYLGDDRRYLVLMNRARDYRANAHRSARWCQ